MIGQAFIKAVAFAVNTAVLFSFFNITPAEATLPELIVSAGISGFATSFIVNPIERVKILMQANSGGLTVRITFYFSIYLFFFSDF